MSSVWSIVLKGVRYPQKSSDYTPEQLTAGVASCGHTYFEVTLTNFVPSTATQPGQFDGINASGDNVSVTNDTTHYSRQELGNLDKKFGPAGTTNAPINGLTIVGGEDHGFSTYRNFTAKNVTVSTLARVNARVDTQIFELGNSLKHIEITAARARLPLP